MPQVRTYDPKRIVITIGSHNVTGLAEDTFLSVEQTGDGTQSQAGADGEVARSISHNPLHRVTLTLQQTSLSNDFLSDLLKSDRASGGGGIVPLQINDLRGSSLFAASQAWVVKWPNIENGAEVSEREWLLDAVATDIHIGGNDL
jgi:hypothetical protein